MAQIWACIAGAMLILAFATALWACLKKGSDEDDRMEAEAAREPVILDAVTEPVPVFVAAVTEEEIVQAAQVVWGEARGIHSRMEQAAVVWCALNRVDTFGDSLGRTITAPGQFAYSPDNPTVDDFGRDLEELVRDVVDRWEREKAGGTDVGRVLPRIYLYFGGENGRNWFRDTQRFYDDTLIWDWRFPDPYERR